MRNITVEVPINIDELINVLTPEQQKILSDKLWATRIERISQKMRKSAKKNKVTRIEIQKMCEEAREKVYEKHCR